MTPQIPLFLTVACVIASVIGFLACAIMLRGTRYDDRARAGMRASLARWGGLFWAGAAAVTIDCSMGASAPVPIAASIGGSLPLGVIGFCWSLIVAAGFTMSRALHYSRTIEKARSADRTPTFPDYTGGGLQVLLAIALVAHISGCAA